MSYHETVTRTVGEILGMSACLAICAGRAVLKTQPLTLTMDEFAALEGDDMNG